MEGYKAYLIRPEKGKPYFEPDKNGEWWVTEYRSENPEGIVGVDPIRRKGNLFSKAKISVRKKNDEN